MMEKAEKQTVERQMNVGEINTEQEQTDRDDRIITDSWIPVDR